MTVVLFIAHAITQRCRAVAQGIVLSAVLAARPRIQHTCASGREGGPDMLTEQGEEVAIVTCVGSLSSVLFMYLILASLDIRLYRPPSLPPSLPSPSPKSCARWDIMLSRV